MAKWSRWLILTLLLSPIGCDPDVSDDDAGDDDVGDDGENTCECRAAGTVSPSGGLPLLGMLSLLMLLVIRRSLAGI